MAWRHGGCLAVRTASLAVKLWAAKRMEEEHRGIGEHRGQSRDHVVFLRLKMKCPCETFRRWIQTGELRFRVSAASEGAVSSSQVLLRFS